jgi:uncharacterized RDD family membrane protein YckC
MGAQLSEGWGEWTMPGQGPVVVDVPDPWDRVAECRETARGRRVAAVVIDYLILAVAALAAYTAAPAWLDTGRLASPEFIAGAAAAVLLYFFLLEARFGQTIGKAFCDVRVTDRWGGAPTAGRVAVRTLLRPIDDFALGLVGALSITFTGYGVRQRLGDIAAGTVVVRASESEVRRAPGFAVATAGLVLLLAPLAFVISPGAADILPRNDNYDIRQTTVRYLSAVAAEDAVGACRETAESQRRALVAAGGDAFPASGSVAACATHSAALVAQFTAAYPWIANQPLTIDRRGDAAVVSTPGIDGLISLGREGETWKVDFLATSREKFMADCAAPPAPADANALCGCAWDAIRAHGVATLQDMKRFNRQVLANRTPAWVAAAIGGCRTP